MTELFPYQVEGAKFLASRKRALLADEMGLGKSAQAIAALREIGSSAFLVICPASVVENWKREIKRFWPECRAGWNVISYDRAVRDRNKVNWLATGGDLVCDEAHYLKTRNSLRTQTILGPKCDGVGGLVERAKHVFFLTGTPTPNNPSELWPVLRAAAPETINSQVRVSRGPGRLIVRENGMRLEHKYRPRPMTYWDFVQRFCVTRDNGFGLQIVKGKNLDDLRERIAPFVLRRKKEQVLKDLPPIRFEELPVEGKLTLNQDEKDWTWVIAKALDEHGVAGLKTIAPHVASLRRATGLAKVEGVVAWIRDWLEGGGKKLVVFAHHREVIDTLARRICESKMHFAAVLTGSTEDRDTPVWDFQNEDSCRVFIGQIQAAGVGITLTAASDVLFAESSWVPADNEQAAMRIHRIGQRNACIVRFAMLPGSVDETIQRAVMRKTADISKLFG